MKDLNLEEETKKEVPIDKDSRETINALRNRHREKFIMSKDVSRDLFIIRPRGYVGYIPIGNKLLCLY